MGLRGIDGVVIRIATNVELDAVRALARASGMATSGCWWQCFSDFRYLSLGRLNEPDQDDD